MCILEPPCQKLPQGNALLTLHLVHLLTQMFPIRQNSWIFVSDTGGMDPKKCTAQVPLYGKAKFGTALEWNFKAWSWEMVSFANLIQISFLWERCMGPGFCFVSNFGIFLQIPKRLHREKNFITSPAKWKCQSTQVAYMTGYLGDMEEEFSSHSPSSSDTSRTSVIVSGTLSLCFSVTVCKHRIISQRSKVYSREF